MATVPNPSIYSPQSGTPTQINVGNGVKYDYSVNNAAPMSYNASGAYIGPKTIYPSGYGPSNASKYYDANGRYIGPPAGTILSVNPASGGLAYGPHTTAARNSLVGKNLSTLGLKSMAGSKAPSSLTAFMQQLGLSGNITGPVSYNDSQTLNNIKERLGFNDQIAGLEGIQKKYTSGGNLDAIWGAYNKALGL